MSIFTYLINDVTQNMLFTNTRHTQKARARIKFTCFPGYQSGPLGGHFLHNVFKKRLKKETKFAYLYF